MKLSLNVPQIFRILMLLVLAASISACGGKTRVESDLGMDDAPDWVNEGTNILNNKGGRLFHGVGSSPQMGVQDLQRSTADNRARAELARILSSYMNVVSTDYMAASGTGKDIATEQSVTRDINNITKVNLSGARVIGRWKNPKTKVIYSIVELDMKQVKNIASKVNMMNEGLRNYISNNGDNIFDRMAK
ncbi:MAG: hypothetical protein HUJ30_03250 [Gammaproteobacteria bacterium]|nr:hypothetical protein [Gammaproteobacteria bacterium]